MLILHMVSSSHTLTLMLTLSQDIHALHVIYKTRENYKDMIYDIIRAKFVGAAEEEQPNKKKNS